MLRRLLLPLTCLLALALPCAAAEAAPDQVMTFEAPAELLDDRTRDRTLQEIQDLGVKRIRALVYWSEFTARSTSTRRRASTCATPTPTRRTPGACSTGSSPRPGRAASR